MTMKVSDGGAGLHPQWGAEVGAEVAVCEGILRCTQPDDLSLVLSPRHHQERPGIFPGSFLINEPDTQCSGSCYAACCACCYFEYCLGSRCVGTGEVEEMGRGYQD